MWVSSAGAHQDGHRCRGLRVCELAGRRPFFLAQKLLYTALYSAQCEISVTRAPGHSSLGMSAPAELSQKNSFACFERGDSTPQLEQAAAQRSVCTATGHEAWQRIAGGLGFVLQSQILRWFAVLDEFSVTFAKSN